MKTLLVFIVHATAVIQPAKGEVPCTNGTVQLVGGPNEYEGRVEFCANGGWTQVCGGGTWGKIPASLVCLHRSANKSLNTNVISGYYGSNNLPMNSVNIRHAACRRMFNDCVNMEIQNQGCSSGLLASVACPVNCGGRSVRLISDAQRPAGGLVEVCLEVDERISFWTGVCYENFTLAAATVICRQLGLLRNDSSVTISRSPMRHWRTYDTIRCIGSESNTNACQRAGYKEGAGCSSVIVNCQGESLVDSTTFPEEATGSEFSSSTASVTTEGNTPKPTLVSGSSSDMLIIITGTVCGIIILLLLIAVAMLTVILVTKSRNSRKRLKDAVPAMVNGSQQQSNTLDSRTPTFNPNYVHTSSEQPSSQSSSLKKLTINNSTSPTFMYPKPSKNFIQTVPLPTPTDSHGYPINNPQRDSGIILPQSDMFLPPEHADPADVHIYAEPDEPGFNSQGHEYAELEEACGDRYQNLSPALHVGGPRPYEVPMVVGGSYVNVTVPKPSIPTPRTENSVECQNMTSQTVDTCDHQYATPGLPS